jgi:hypothetical protein
MWWKEKRPPESAEARVKAMLGKHRPKEDHQRRVAGYPRRGAREGGSRGGCEPWRCAVLLWR